jgi:hypothetical protein
LIFSFAGLSVTELARSAAATDWLQLEARTFPSF